MEKKCDGGTLQAMERIASHFIDLLYNDVYSKSVEAARRSTAGKSLTDTYRQQVEEYTSRVESDVSFCKEMIEQLHLDYRAKYANSITIERFVNLVVAQFVPKEYFGEFTTSSTDTALKNILVLSLKQFSAHLLSGKMLKCVIDDHQNADNIAILQEIYLRIFVKIRNEYFTKFAKVASKHPDEKLRSALRDELKLRVEAQAKCDELQTKYSKLIEFVEKVKTAFEAKMQSYEAVIREQARRIRDLESDVAKPPYTEPTKLPYTEPTKLPQAAPSKPPHVEPTRSPHAESTKTAREVDNVLSPSTVPKNAASLIAEHNDYVKDNEAKQDAVELSLDPTEDDLSPWLEG